MENLAHPDVAEADRRAIARIPQGDLCAVEELYDRHCRAIFSLAVRILENAADAEEVVQDVFAQVWRQASRYDDTRGAPVAWLLMMARSRAIDRLRARRGTGQGLPSLDSPPGLPNQEQQVITSEDIGRLRTALHTLSDSQRSAIELAYYEGLSQSAIAERLGEPLGTVKTRIRAGLQRLRDAFRRDENT